MPTTSEPAGAANSGADDATAPDESRPTDEPEITDEAPHPESSAPRYRHDLDGVRGLAIALVVIFHIWSGRVSGGVDVFLTLSGYFFAGSLLRSVTRTGGPGDPIRVILRLARRLLPTLAVVLGTVTVATWLFLPRTRWGGITDQLVASLSYRQNWELAGIAADYAAAGSAVSPLQHLWSMSVQGQFYLLAVAAVFVLAVVLRHRGPVTVRRGVGLTALVGALASFAYAIHAHGIDQEWNYYSTTTRLWELLAGVALACFAEFLVLPRRLRGLAAAAGLAMIASCGVIFDGAELFPGPAALYPVGATLLLVIAGTTGRDEPTDGPAARPASVLRALATRPPRALGNLAYALYVWHWPLLIFVLALTDADAASPPVGVGVLVTSLLLAWLTHRYVEEPLRVGGGRPRPPRRGRRAVATPGAAPAAAPVAPVAPRAAPASTRATALVIAAVVGVLTFSAWWANELKRHQGFAGGRALAAEDHPGARVLLDGTPVRAGVPVIPDPLDVDGEYPLSTDQHCMVNFRDTQSVTCAYGDIRAPTTVALVGGSHSEHWLTALDLLGREHGFRVLTFLKAGCTLSTYGQSVPDSGHHYPECRTWSDTVLRQLVWLDPDLIVTTSTRPVGGARIDGVPEEYLDAWGYLVGHGQTIVAIRDNVWLSDHGRGGAPECLEDGGDPASCGVPRGVALAPVDPALAASLTLPGVHPIDLNDGICGRSHCDVIVGNIMVYRDSHHLGATYVRTLADALYQRLRPFLSG